MMLMLLVLERRMSDRLQLQQLVGEVEKAGAWCQSHIDSMEAPVPEVTNEGILHRLEVRPTTAALVLGLYHAHRKYRCF